MLIANGVLWIVLAVILLFSFLCFDPKELDKHPGGCLCVVGFLFSLVWGIITLCLA